MPGNAITTEQRLPVAGVRLAASRLAAATRRYRYKQGGVRLAKGAAVLGAAYLYALAFLANDYPFVQQVAFVLTMGYLMAGMAWVFYGLPGIERVKSLVRPAPAAALYPPNALAENLRDVMQSVLDILATRQPVEQRQMALEAKVPEAALAFSGFFGRRVDRVKSVQLGAEKAEELGVGYKLIEMFPAMALRFATYTSGQVLRSEVEVRDAGVDLLTAYRDLMKLLDVDIAQVRHDGSIIDPVLLPKPGDADAPERTSILTRSANLFDSVPPVVTRIRGQDTELRRLRSHLAPEDADEWTRIMDHHIPGLEGTFADAYEALGALPQVVPPFIHALELIADSLDLIIARAKSGVADGLETQVRFISARHGNDLSTSLKR